MTDSPTRSGRRPGRRLDPREVERLRRAVARAGRLAERGPPPPLEEPDRETIREALEAARPPVPPEEAETAAPSPSEPTPSEPTPSEPTPPPREPEGGGPARTVAASPAPARPARERQDSERPAPDVEAAWAALPGAALQPRHLARHLVVTAARDDPAHGAFDVLRTRLLAEMRARGWRRLGITSPTPGCGKTFTAANLAVTLARLGEVRTLLLDLDLRRPTLARVLGVAPRVALGDLLRGAVDPAAALLRAEGVGLHLGRLALGPTARPERFPAELLAAAATGEALARAEALLDPHLTLMDLPPVLAQDDVLALRPHLDALLLVAGGGMTTPRELRETARRIGTGTPILGVVLNKAEGEEVLDYAYAYG